MTLRLCVGVCRRVCVCLQLNPLPNFLGACVLTSWIRAQIDESILNLWSQPCSQLTKHLDLPDFALCFICKRLSSSVSRCVEKLVLKVLVLGDFWSSSNWLYCGQFPTNDRSIHPFILTSDYRTWLILHSSGSEKDHALLKKMHEWPSCRWITLLLRSRMGKSNPSYGAMVTL